MSLASQPSPIDRATEHGHGPAAVEALPMERVNPPEPFFRGFWRTMAQIWSYRELLVGLTRKELKVKYKDSLLGFLWSMARPLFQLLVYWIAIGEFLGSGIPNFPIYLFIGLTGWTMFTDILSGATGSIVANSGLIKKVYFPRELLPLAAVGATLVHFLMQLLILFTAMLAFRFDFFGWNLLLAPLVVVVLLLLAAGVGLLLAAANVYLRDTQHLLDVAILFLFWMSPIVYPVTFVSDRLAAPLVNLYLLNPLTNVVMGFQRAFYKNVSVETSPGEHQQVLFGGNVLPRLVILLVVGSVFFWFAQRVFARAQGNFAQEL